MKCIDEQPTVHTETIFVNEKDEDLKCRICYDNSRPLISVCDCSGSIGLVHDVCILDWMAKKIMVSDNMEIPSCEICHQKYAARMEVGPQKIEFNLLVKKIKSLALSDTMSSLAQIILFFFSLLTMVYFFYSSLSLQFLLLDIDVIVQEIFLKVISQLFVLKACKDHFFLRKRLLEESMTRTIDIIL